MYSIVNAKNSMVMDGVMFSYAKRECDWLNDHGMDYLKPFRIIDSRSEEAKSIRKREGWDY